MISPANPSAEIEVVTHMDQLTELNTLAFVIVAKPCQRPVNMDRPFITAVTQQSDHPLRLAKGINANQMGPVAKLRNRSDQFFNFAFGIRMDKDRQTESRLRYEDVARHRLKSLGGGIGNGLVIPGGNNGCATVPDPNLGGTQHMTGREKCNTRAIDDNFLTKICDLTRVAEILAVTDCHDLQRTPRCKHFVMPGLGMIGMAVGDQGAFNRHHGINEEVTGFAVQALRARFEQVAQKVVPPEYNLISYDFLIYGTKCKEKSGACRFLRDGRLNEDLPHPATCQEISRG